MEARNCCTVTPTQIAGKGVKFIVKATVIRQIPDPKFSMVQVWLFQRRSQASNSSASKMRPNGVMSRDAERDRRTARSETGYG